MLLGPRQERLQFLSRGAKRKDPIVRGWVRNRGLDSPKEKFFPDADLLACKGSPKTIVRAFLDQNPVLLMKSASNRQALIKAAFPLFLAASHLLTCQANAQGSNNCADAELIVGTGPNTFHQFNTGSASTNGFEEGVLQRPGLRQIANDVWFRWVATKTAVFMVNTDHVPPTNGATAVAIYRYGCPSGPGRAIAGRMGAEVGGGILAYPSFGAEEGVEYLIRVGNTVSSNRTRGVFTIEEVDPPGILATEVNPANGRTYHLLEHSSWSVARVAALQLGGDLVTVNDQEENDWLMTTFFTFGGQNRSLWLGYNDAETEGTWVWANGETSDFENWSPDASPPNNGNQYEHYAHIRRDRDDGTWNDLLGFPGVSFFYDEVHGVVEIGGGTDPNAEILITEITHDVENDRFTLTWTSTPNASYAVVYDPNIDGQYAAEVEGNIASGGETTSFTFDNPIEGARRLFFRVRR